MTIGQIHAAFARGDLTPQEAAMLVRALRPRPSRARHIFAALLPIAIAVAAYALVFLGGTR